MLEAVAPTPDRGPLPAGMSIAEAAREVRVGEAALRAMLSGHAPIGPDIAFRLGRLCGGRPSYWSWLKRRTS